MKRRKAQTLAAGVLGSVLLASAAAAASTPAVVSVAASRVRETSAQLNGTVNPDGSSTRYYFQWGLTSIYGDTGAAHSAGDGSRAVAIHEDASDLIPGTVYHYRLVAGNGYGISVGADRTLRTAGHPPPAVETGTATEVNANGATLTGAINPGGQATTWYMQWGTSTGYGQQTAPQKLTASSSPEDVAVSLEGLLAPGTIYHYRLVATHGIAQATTYGADATFMTFPSPRPLPGLRTRIRPHLVRRRPFVLSTSGAIGPGSVPAAYACSGAVRVRFFNGRRRAATTYAGVQPDCTFGAVTAFQHLPRHKRGQHAVALRVVITFLGNGYLAPRRARIRHVTLV
jgi:hypothetical protein